MNIIVRSVALGIVAVGQTLVIIGASIDLSVAYLISITAVMSSYIMQGDPHNVPMAILVVFAHRRAVGLVNGLIITKLKVNSFIATLGTSLIIDGMINATFSNYTGSVPQEFPVFRVRQALRSHPGLDHCALADGYCGLAAADPHQIRRAPVRRRRQRRGRPAFRPADRPGA